jgi:hypothetical protein
MSSFSTSDSSSTASIDSQCFFFSFVNEHLDFLEPKRNHEEDVDDAPVFSGRDGDSTILEA